VNITLKGKWPGIGAVLAAYGLLVVLRIVTWEFSHTYNHWIEEFGYENLPSLTLLVLPVLGFSSSNPASSAIVAVASTAFFIWPGLQLARYLRRPAGESASELALGLLAWLCLLLAAWTMVAVGLWLPFSLL